MLWNQTLNYNDPGYYFKWSDVSCDLKYDKNDYIRFQAPITEYQPEWYYNASGINLQLTYGQERPSAKRLSMPMREYFWRSIDTMLAAFKLFEKTQAPNDRYTSKKAHEDTLDDWLQLSTEQARDAAMLSGHIINNRVFARRDYETLANDILGGGALNPGYSSIYTFKNPIDNFNFALNDMNVELDWPMSSDTYTIDIQNCENERLSSALVELFTVAEWKDYYGYPYTDKWIDQAKPNHEFATALLAKLNIEYPIMDDEWWQQLDQLQDEYLDNMTRMLQYPNWYRNNGWCRLAGPAPSMGLLGLPWEHIGPWSPMSPTKPRQLDIVKYASAIALIKSMKYVPYISPMLHFNFIHQKFTKLNWAEFSINVENLEFDEDGKALVRPTDVDIDGYTTVENVLEYEKELKWQAYPLHDISFPDGYDCHVDWTVQMSYTQLTADGFLPQPDGYIYFTFDDIKTHGSMQFYNRSGQADLNIFGDIQLQIQGLQPSDLSGGILVDNGIWSSWPTDALSRCIYSWDIVMQAHPHWKDELNETNKSWFMSKRQIKVLGKNDNYFVADAISEQTAQKDMAQSFKELISNRTNQVLESWLWPIGEGAFEFPLDNNASEFDQYKDAAKRAIAENLEVYRVDSPINRQHMRVQVIYDSTGKPDCSNDVQSYMGQDPTGYWQNVGNVQTPTTFEIRRVNIPSMDKFLLDYNKAIEFEKKNPNIFLVSGNEFEFGSGPIIEYGALNFESTQSK